MQEPQTLWRISNHHSLAGVGGERASGRWHAIGRRIVYLAASAAGALVEHLVHLDMDESELPNSYTLLRVEVPPDLQIEFLDCSSTNGWEEKVDLNRELGDEWLDAVRTPLARVSSVVVPETWNYLLNPMHENARFIKVVSAREVRFDPRLLRKVRL